MRRGGLPYKVLNRTYEYFMGEDLSEADEFDIEHLKGSAILLGGLAITGYGSLVEAATNNWEGDVLGAVPILTGLYLAGRGAARTFKNLRDWKPEDIDT